MNLDELDQSLRECQTCRLASGRTQVVFGMGYARASIMFVGEAPGFYEDKQGLPFVGTAGRLLTELLESVGLSRSKIYIANIIKCQPPNNRNPQSDEVEACKPFLLQQIRLIKPRLVYSLENFAMQTLLEKKIGITNVRGQVFRLPDFILFPLLHSAAALHHGHLMTPLREDFQTLKHLLDELSQEDQHTSLSPTTPVQMNLF